MKKAKTCKWFPVCPMKFYWEAGKLDDKWIKNFCHGDWLSCVRYQKEEAGIFHPDNLLPDGQVDERLD